MAESSNVSGLVLGVVSDLHTTHSIHLSEEAHELLLVGGDGGGGLLEVYIVITESDR